MSLEQLHQLLATVRGGLDDARAHASRARGLLEESRRAIVEVQAQAQPWLPPQLAQAFDQLDVNTGKLAGADDLLNRYEARL
ncbi:hypothetical protein SAMN05421810_103118 [Amycolatopsis arida]|uniref:Uncharacterized protein n=1 Tax=Amycolatopsis arida TaxID=587909 RepID=A0A1I5SFX1_9PSEU|nr:hypothetical protein [Amycolatopsis arida]TDX96498.1 hypothetical protein CLV69_103640 [Amycolatopsis arida]SFP69236.1 hypothetical protein SAMN05421810_103118 [Amycolatopsis arida]